MFRFRYGYGLGLGLGLKGLNSRRAFAKVLEVFMGIEPGSSGN